MQGRQQRQPLEAGVHRSGEENRWQPACGLTAAGLTPSPPSAFLPYCAAAIPVPEAEVPVAVPAAQAARQAGVDHAVPQAAPQGPLLKGVWASSSKLQHTAGQQCQSSSSSRRRNGQQHSAGS